MRYFEIAREQREQRTLGKDQFIREREREREVLSLSQVKRGMENLILILKSVAEYLLETLNLNHNSQS